MQRQLLCDEEVVVVCVCVIVSGSCSVAARCTASYTSLKVFFERTNYSLFFEQLALVFSFLISFFPLLRFLRFLRIPSDQWVSFCPARNCTLMTFFRCAARETDRIEAQHACKIMHEYTFYVELHYQYIKLLSFFFFFFFPCH